RAERFGCKSADMNLDPINIDADHDHVGIGKARWEVLVEIAGPQTSHFRNIFNDRRTSDQSDIAVTGGMLISESDQGCRSDLSHLARAFANEDPPGAFIRPWRSSRRIYRPRIRSALQRSGGEPAN